MKTTILIADDHPIFRRGLLELIETTENYHIIAEAADGEQALLAMRDNLPDIAIVDIAMPKLSGLDVLTKTNHWAHRPAFVILTMYDDEAYLRRALEFGALGYVLKDNAESELLACLDDVCQGKHYISPGVSRNLAESSLNSENLLGLLTSTERKIFFLLAEYNTNNEIAELLGISVRTVQNHRANICLKLGLRGHNALIKLATQTL